MTHGIYLFDIGRRIYQVFFDDYNYYKEIPLVPYLQDVLCKMNVPAPKQVPCGNGFCESILCGHLSNGYLRCQYLAGCILDQCYYWRHSSRKWSVGVTYCEIINSTMLMIYNETIQEEIYKIFGDFEYWTGLWSNLYANPVWTWSGTNLTLVETNYTNWSDGQPDTDNGNNLCISDTNSSELTQHWKVLPCTNAETQRVFMCTRAPSLPYDSKPEKHGKPLVFIL
uniref:C-type lectin domain-containing protein n=1 Tax=Acrobeloides nanus TaxID=290746 RepID=A0A914EG61_9BILA